MQQGTPCDADSECLNNRCVELTTRLVTVTEEVEIGNRATGEKTKLPRQVQRRVVTRAGTCN